MAGWEKCGVVGSGCGFGFFSPCYDERNVTCGGSLPCAGNGAFKTPLRRVLFRSLARAFAFAFARCPGEV